MHAESDSQQTGKCYSIYVYLGSPYMPWYSGALDQQRRAPLQASGAHRTAARRAAAVHVLSATALVASSHAMHRQARARMRCARLPHMHNCYIDYYEYRICMHGGCDERASGERRRELDYSLLSG